jgi:hypothetical protein
VQFIEQSIFSATAMRQLKSALADLLRYAAKLIDWGPPF